MAHFDFNLANSLADISNNVEINCVVSDLTNPDIDMIANHLFEIPLERSYGSELNMIFKKRITAIENKHAVNSTFIETLSLVSFFAVDYKKDTEFSFIQAKHYMIPEYTGHVNTIFCTAYPGTEIYKFYRTQIEILEKKAILAKEKNNE